MTRYQLTQIVAYIDLRWQPAYIADEAKHLTALTEAHDTLRFLIDVSCSAIYGTYVDDASISAAGRRALAILLEDLRQRMCQGIEGDCWEESQSDNVKEQNP